MRLLFLLISISLSAQLSNDLQTQIKFKSYSYLDSINIYSRDYTTQLIEGSGLIRNRDNKNIGSINYSTEIMRDKNDKIVRIIKSESNHYKKYDRKPQKSIINEIIIYFDEHQQPDLAKYISKTYMSNALVTSKNKLFNLKENQESNPDFKHVKILLDETKKHIK